MATRKINRKCIVCSGHYSYCSACSEDASKPSWYGIFCSENCKDIYDTTLRYGEGNLSKDEAKEALSKLDLSNKENFHPVIKSRVNEILGIKEPKKESKKEEKPEEIAEG